MNYYEYYKSIGRCPNCKRNKSAPNHVLCLECMSDVSERNHRQRDKWTHERRKAESKRAVENKRKRKERRKAEGVCVECGKRPPKEGRISCKICLRKHRERMKGYCRRKGHKPRELFYYHDKCWICCADALPGKRVCAAHMDMCLNNLSNGHHDNTNHIWRKLKYGKEPAF